MSWESLNRVSIVTTILGTALAVGAYVFSVEWRLSTLASQTQAALTSPIIGNVMAEEKMKAMPNILPDSPSTIEATCSDLAIKAAQLEADSKLSASSGVQALMTRLGCFKGN